MFQIFISYELSGTRMRRRARVFMSYFTTSSLHDVIYGENKNKTWTGAHLGLALIDNSFHCEDNHSFSSPPHWALPASSVHPGAALSHKFVTPEYWNSFQSRTTRSVGGV